MCIAGDFNFPNIKWNQDGTVSQYRSGNLLSNMSHDFIETLTENALAQSVSEPTFTTADGRETNTLDLIISDDASRIRELRLGPPLGEVSQGHATIRFELAVSNSIDREKYQSNCFVLRKGDYQRMKLHLTSLNWDDILRNKSTEDAYSTFLEVYKEICHK